MVDIQKSSTTDFRAVHVIGYGGGILSPVLYPFLSRSDGSCRPMRGRKRGEDAWRWVVWMRKSGGLLPKAKERGDGLL